jgi:hyaluronan synthase
MQHTSDIPTADWAGRNRALLFSLVPFTVFAVWSLWHVMAVLSAMTGKGNPMAFTWAVSFLMLWWVIVAWFEKPYTVTPRQKAYLDDKIVTVQVPAYNEDPSALHMCLQSLFQQTRLPNRIKVVDDGSDSTLVPQYLRIADWFRAECYRLGIEPTWKRTANQGKRGAQMEVLREDNADIFVTLDSDSVLERDAIDRGIAPFADPEVMSVAGMVVVWNSKDNFLTMLTCMLYNAFTRGFRSAQSVMGQVMVNSGTLAFYRGWVIRNFCDIYTNETFLNRKMNMNDDSFMTFAAMLQGKTVHQPNSVAFTLAPNKWRHYFNQQLRWMRGTNVRTLWWLRYLSPKKFAWWMPVIENISFFMSFIVLGRVLMDDRITGSHPWKFAVTTIVFGIALSYVVALRYFIIRRSDESIWFTIAVFALAPVASLWRLIFLRPLMLYAMFTFWKIGKWGTRDVGVEVTA